MTKDVLVVLDCGATNVRVIAVDASGTVVAKSMAANATLAAAENPAWHLWPIDEILAKFAGCSQAVCEELTCRGFRVVGLTVTSFGVDGALVDAAGNPIYPVISWKCPRTVAVMEDIGRYFAPADLQRVSGVGHFSFNTLYKLVWFRENRPELLDRAHAWLFFSSLITHHLTGVLSSDRTMVGTSQLFDLNKDTWSDEILASVGLSSALFPPIVNPGEIIGQLRPEAAAQLGFPAGLPVLSAGHDTQLALFGSGAEINQPVLSSGTWEILMVRATEVNTDSLTQIAESTCELDAAPGFYNPGLQWLASGVIEWVKNTCWRGESGDNVYAQMVAEARAVPPGCDGLTMSPNLLVGSGGIGGGGAYQGLSINSSRGHLYRAALEALSETLARQLRELEAIGNFSAQQLILVGGGSKNHLWNQLKANALQIPVHVVAENEMTVLGAALYGFAGLGYFPSPEAARAAVRYDYQIFEPERRAIA